MTTRIGVLCYAAYAGVVIVQARCMVRTCSAGPWDALAPLVHAAPVAFLLGAAAMTVVAPRAMVLKVMLFLTLSLWLVEARTDGVAPGTWARLAYAAAVLWGAIWWWAVRSGPGVSTARLLRPLDPVGPVGPDGRPDLVHPRQEAAYRAAVQVLGDIRAAVPHLQHRFDASAHCPVELVFPRQPGLDFEVKTWFHGDSLSFSTGEDWYEYFPIDEPDVMKACREAVVGVLDGTWRIEQVWLDGQVVKSILERPTAGGWKRAYVSRRLHLPIGRYTDTVLRNTGAAPPPDA